MQTLTTRTGIKVLLPQVPIDATGLNVSIGYLSFISDGWGSGIFLKQAVGTKMSILGTCWREGGKLMCEGFDPLTLGFKPVRKDMDDPYWVPSKSCTEVMDSWLLSIGEKIKEGHKIVVIKVE